MLFKKTGEVQNEAAPAAEIAPETPGASGEPGEPAPVPDAHAGPADAREHAQSDTRPEENPEELRRRWEELKSGAFRDLYRRDLEALRGEMESREAKRAARQREERAVREQYPEFSLEEASKNPDFAALVAREVPMLQAYRAVNHEALVSEAVRRALGAAGGGPRPRTVLPEHAGSDKTRLPQGGSRSLTKAGREEIARRVMRGERVSF